jgi:aquaporin Z
MRLPWTLFAAEFLGTAVLVGVGLSFVILDFGQGSPLPDLIRSPGLRRAVTGFLFGSTGALVAVSPLGKESGAHINPVVTLVFWVRGKIGTRHAAGYILAQLAGGIAGALPLLFWGEIGRSISYGATFPGSGYNDWLAILGEAAATFALIVLLFLFISHAKLRPFTPLLFPALYSLMVYIEAPLSGTSTNPARSLGPAVISWNWKAWWVYWVGPIAGALVGTAFHRFSRLNRLELKVAKLYHFEHDPHGVFTIRRREKNG